jgi:hypothetical protein
MTFASNGNVGSAATIALLLASAGGCDRTPPLQPNPVSSTVSSAAPVPSGPFAGLADAGVSGTLTIFEPRHAFGVADANGDGTDDVIALASVMTDDDSERRLIAFDGKTRGILWKSAPLRPWAGLPGRARLMVLVGGGNVALATGWTNLDFYDLKSGAKKDSLQLTGIPGNRTCVDPKNPARYYVELSDGGALRYHKAGGALVDVAAMKAEPSPPPDFCPTDWVPDEHVLSDCYFKQGTELARAQCAPKNAAPASIPGFQLSYVITTPEAALAIGNAPGTPADPGNVMVVRFDPEKKKVLWTRTIAEVPHAEPTAKKEEREIHQADVTPAGIYVLIDVLGSTNSPMAQRLLMLDTNTGAIRFERAISEGAVQDPRVVGARIYLPKKAPFESASWYTPKGEIDVLDANTGTPLFTLGGGEKF